MKNRFSGIGKQMAAIYNAGRDLKYLNVIEEKKVRLMAVGGFTEDQVMGLVGLFMTSAAQQIHTDNRTYILWSMDAAYERAARGDTFESIEQYARSLIEKR